MDFPPEFFRPGDPPEKLLDHELLNWLLERVTKNISVGPQLQLSENSYGLVIALARRILDFRVVELVEELNPCREAFASCLRYTEADGITRDDNLQIQIYDVFGIKEVVGSRGVAFELIFTDIKRWVYIPVGFICQGSSSTTSSSGLFSSSGGPPCFEQLPNDITILPYYNPNVQQLLGHDDDACLRWYDVDLCDSSSGL